MTDHDPTGAHAASAALSLALGRVAALSAHTGVMLFVRWLDQPLPMVEIHHDGDASSHAKLAAKAHLPALEEALVHWACHTPLLWGVRARFPSAEPMMPGTEIMITYRGGQTSKLECKLPCPSAAQDQWRLVTISIPGVGQKSTLIERLLRALSRVNGPLYCWTSTMGTKSIRFVSGPDKADAVLMDRLIRAGKTTLTRASLDGPNGTIYARESAEPLDLADLSKNIWG